jgi:hypothetical protein
MAIVVGHFLVPRSLSSAEIVHKVIEFLGLLFDGFVSQKAASAVSVRFHYMILRCLLPNFFLLPTAAEMGSFGAFRILPAVDV